MLIGHSAMAIPRIVHGVAGRGLSLGEIPGRYLCGVEWTQPMIGILSGARSRRWAVNSAVAQFFFSRCKSRLMRPPLFICTNG